MNNALKLEISAETQEQADSILNHLLSEKLVTGGQLLHAPARFLWKEEVVDMDYFTIVSYTLERHKQAIIDSVKTISVEEVPMIVFTPFEGNQELISWIQKTVS